MLKKSLFSPAQPRRVETHLSPSGVLASFRGSTYRMRFSGVEALKGLFRSPRTIARANGPHEVRFVPLASSLAAALLDGLFEHPARWCPVVLGVRTSEVLGVSTEFFRSLLETRRAHRIVCGALRSSLQAMSDMRSALALFMVHTVHVLARASRHIEDHDRWLMRDTLPPIDADFRDSKLPRC